MQNQYAGLTGVLAAQRMTERRQQADQERLTGSTRRPRRRRHRVRRRWWQVARWPVGV